MNRVQRPEASCSPVFGLFVLSIAIAVAPAFGEFLDVLFDDLGFRVFALLALGGLVGILNYWRRETSPQRRGEHREGPPTLSGVREGESRIVAPR